MKYDANQNYLYILSYFLLNYSYIYISWSEIVGSLQIPSAIGAREEDQKKKITPERKGEIF